MQRPWYLTIILIISFLLSSFGTLISLINLIFIVFSPQNSVFFQQINASDLPLWFIVGLALLTPFSLVGVLLLWKWQIKGLYILVGTVALIDLLRFINTQTISLRGTFSDIIGLAILLLAMRPIRTKFK